MSKEKTSRLMLVEMENYEAPEIVESYTSNKYISYGEENSYFKYLQECYNGSPTNRAIITAIAQMIYGKGLDFIDSDQQEEVLKKIQELFKPKDLRLITMDFKQFGQCCFQVGYNKEHTKILKIKHQPVMTIAKGKMNRMGEITKYWYSADWTNPSLYPPKAIPAFGTSNKQVELMYIGNYTHSSGLMYYDNVDYQAGLQYAKIEEEISNFHLNNIMNGFAPGALLNFKDGKPNVSEQLEIESKVKKKWGGSSNAGSIMVTFTDDGEEAPELQVLSQSDLDKQYEFVTKLAENKLLVSHRVTSPLLLGIKDASGFSSNSDELISSYKLFNTTVISPMQEILIDGIKEVLEFNKISVDLYFSPLFPIDFLDEDADVDKDDVEKETGVTSKENPSSNPKDKDTAKDKKEE